jgi:hypothetical protein
VSFQDTLFASLVAWRFATKEQEGAAGQKKQATTSETEKGKTRNQQYHYYDNNRSSIGTVLFLLICDFLSVGITTRCEFIRNSWTNNYYL